MKRAALLSIILLYVVSAVLGGGLHLILADAPVKDAGCGETQTHYCNHAPPAPDHDIHTCSICQTSTLKGMIESYRHVESIRAPFLTAVPYEAVLPDFGTSRLIQDGRAPPADPA